MTNPTPDTPRKYVMRIARFVCGCIYRLSADTLLYCPNHRHMWHRGIITAEETISLPHPMDGTQGNAPEIQNLVRHRTLTNYPVVYENDETNSYYMTRATASPDSGFRTEQSREAGLCSACLIENDETTPTSYALCECGDRDCRHRWCGSLQGLHAVWPLHAKGGLQQITGKDDDDEDEVVAFFSRQEVGRTPAESLAAETHAGRIQDAVADWTAGLEHGELTHRERQVLEGPVTARIYRHFLGTTDPQKKKNALENIQRHLIRFHVIGAWPPPPAKPPETQLELPL